MGLKSKIDFLNPSLLLITCWFSFVGFNYSLPFPIKNTRVILLFITRFLPSFIPGKFLIEVEVYYLVKGGVLFSSKLGFIPLGS